MDEPIAIVGSACRFPGSASSSSKLWNLLVEPRDVLVDFPPERLNLSSFYNADGETHGRTDVQNRAYLLQEDFRNFDAAFFRINPKEARGIDPQQRLLLETVAEAFESAGWPLDAIEGSQTSVHVGAMTADFHDIQMRDAETLPTYTATGTARSILSNRVSYFFNLKGPSMTIDTACSSSLVALHQAVQSLRSGEATQAVVAGTTLLLDSGMYIAESKLHMLSPDSRSRMWDKSANGYARGEGCGAVVLKPLSKALEDGDHVECVVRQTGVNSDGRTNGITMPSSEAQAALIRQTYARAGLDPVADRCDFFECHGTGTLAGDPVEARAIHDTFFPGREGEEGGDEEQMLYCGSVKTIIGHLEGCAGLAGVLKASLAIQNRTIPPNMHFRELNPAIAPFAGHLRVPTVPLPWDTVGPPGRPLRASVNSFGFGGTNAHVILESYDVTSSFTTTTTTIPAQISSPHQKSLAKGPSCLPGPFVFSAKTRSSLVRILRNTVEYLQQHPSLPLDAFSHVLQSRRTAFSMRTVITASDRQSLLDALDRQIRRGEGDNDPAFAVRALAATSSTPSKLLGVFTGQGAQWASMGRELLKHSPHFRTSMETCEDALKSIPNSPSWSLMEELSVSSSSAADDRLSRPEFSQTLCTAIQIALVDLLRVAGIEFNAVIGHSSGEIGAAYAAGLLTVRDAMGIAYYRGFVAHLAKGPTAKKGAMMAVGISHEAAKDFCSRPQWKDRVWVAASNAPSTVTLSGDIDAIQEAKASFDADGVFARQLKVAIAYHSAHMHACMEAYRSCLEKLNVRPQTPRKNCVWSSSVYKDVELLHSRAQKSDVFEAQYWVDNMVNPVLFSQALEATMTRGGSFALGMEVGPHPALKTAVSQTLKPLGDDGSVIPYTGCLERKGNDIEALASAIGFVWAHLGPLAVHFDGWRIAFGQAGRLPMMKNLPSYAWDHDQTYWHESRISHNNRLRQQRPHELLGRVSEDAQNEITWRNVLHARELPWLHGHMFQGQVIFPGAGYISMAVQAASTFVRGRDIKMVEIRDFTIPHALVLDDERDGVEILFSIRSQRQPAPDSIADDGIVEADFTCYSSADERILNRNCAGRLFIHLGQTTSTDLPPSSLSQADLIPLSVDRFFDAADRMGIQYDDLFRATTSLNRIWGHAQATASWSAGALGDRYKLHPAVLDVAFQAGLATFVSTAEGALGSTFLPASIRRIIIDPAQNYQNKEGGANTAMDAHLVHSTSSTIEVDINLFDGSGAATGVQVDGLVLKAVAEPVPADDRLLFAKDVWDIDAASGVPNPVSDAKPRQAEKDYIDAVERTALFFLHDLTRQIRPGEIKSFRLHHQRLLKAIPEIVSPVREGRHSILKKEWLNDTRDSIRPFAERYPDSVDIALLTSVGENLASVVRGESEMLEHMLKDDMLSRLYVEGRGFAACNDYAADMMRTITHKHPRCKILEIGAGTGGTTGRVLNAIDNAYLSYTYTDISAGFFEKAAEKFSDHAQRMEFKVFNAEHTPAEQGFEEGSYDIIIAANVLHATCKMSQTMENTRRLLRPGGFLVAVEVTGGMLRETGLMAGLEGWWLGADDGRRLNPGITVTEWDKLLNNTGFSGVETVVYDMPDNTRHNCSVFCTRAVDDRFDLIRDPLASSDQIPEANVLIVGGRTLPVSKAVRQVEKLLRRCDVHVTTCPSIDDLDPTAIQPDTSILCLAELDKPIFSESMSASRLENLQEMLGGAQNVLWITRGRRANDPYSNMMIGIGRALAFELPHVTIQFLDFEDQALFDMDMVVQYLLRMVLLSSLQFRDHNMLWAQEHEVAVTEDGTLIPRVVHDTVANESLNAKRRRITKSVERSEQVKIVHDGLQLSLDKGRGVSEVPVDAVEMDVQLSMALHSGPQTSSFLSYGLIKASERPALAISAEDSSTVAVKEEALAELPSPIATSFGPKDLVAIGSALIALHVLSSSPKDGTILVHNPNNNIANAITEAASKAGRSVLLITPSAERKGSLWTAVHPLAQRGSVARSIPANASTLFCFSDVTVDNITPLLPKNCTVQAFEPASVSLQDELLSTAINLTKSAELGTDTSVVSIHDVFHSRAANDNLSVVLDWKRNGSLNVAVPPLDVSSFFHADKTYFLVGMTGELGQSLCHFMLQCGARHIVLASRSGAAGAQWPAHLEVAGADVRIVQMDVSDRKQVSDTVAKLRATMPEIAGVANAALVLEDSLFVNATPANVEHQLKPKVDGTAYLDEEFAHDDLEFFLTFSSLGTTYGNAGQSIYHAANMFMTSFVEGRRRNGKAGSVIDVGMIVDVGYVAKAERAGSKIEEHLRKEFYTPLAESEFHHLVLQGILAGRPESSLSSDVTMGIQRFVDDPEAQIKPQWYANPRFSHMIMPPVSDDSITDSGTSVQQLRAQYQEAESIVDANDALQQLFCKKIESMMKIPAASIDVDAPLADLGLDSLLAVEIRTWLLKEMHLEVPLLSILGRDPIGTLCLNALQADWKAKGLDITMDTTKAKAQPALTPDLPAKTVEALEVNDSDSIDRSATPSDSSVAPEAHTSPDADLSSASSVSDSDEVPAPVLEYTRVERTSFAQASLLFLQNFLEDPTTFNVTAEYKISGPLNATRFSRALEKTLARHEAYRTCFFTDPGSLEMKQGVIASNGKPVAHLTHVRQSQPDDVARAFDALSKRAWDIAHGQTFEATLITHEPDLHTVVFGCHHIFMDGMSWHIFLQDLNNAYMMQPLEPIAMSYADFSRQQEEALRAGRLEESISYWAKTMDPTPSVLPLLPFAQTRRRETRRAYRNHNVERRLGSGVVQRVEEASKACQVSPMQFYLAVVQSLFARLVGVEDLCIGVTYTGRPTKELSHTVGHFTELLPMRFAPDVSRTFKELVAGTRETVLSGLEHAQVPLNVLLERLGMQRSSSYTPLFQVAFNYRVGDMLQRNVGNCNMDLVQYEDTKKPYDLTFNITQMSKGGHMVEVSSSDNLYSSAATELVMDTFVGLLEAASRNPTATVQNYKLHTEAQVERSLTLGRGPRVAPAWPATLSERFQQVAAEFSQGVAIRDEGGSMTYAQLSRRVAALATALSRTGVAAKSRVAVLCQPSIDTYATMLAILHLGAIYVPLDLSLPSARHGAMIDACSPEFLVCHAASADAAAECAGQKSSIRTLDLSKLPPTPADLPNTPPTAPQGESFLLFTSGSTGIPKGIKVSQSGIMNYAAAKSAELGLGRVTVLQQSSTGFDMSVAQAFNAFANGGTLVIAPSKARGDPVAIAQLMHERDVEFTICTPSEYAMLASYAGDTLRQCTRWRHACSGGEAVTDNLISELRRLELPHLGLLDCYGPTEISCAATFQTTPLNAGTPAVGAPNTVGKAIRNTSIYILDSDNNEALPAGFPGEICVGGAGVAAGYLDPTATSAKFVQNPFASSEDGAHGWHAMYRTGDKGYLREDGSLVFLGRLDGDSLVKLRGLRIELTEVANVLLDTAEGAIADVGVTVRGQPEFLVAHVVFSHGRHLGDAELDALCAKLPLPRYMIPSMVIPVDRLPTTPNGKLDRKALAQLPLPDRSRQQSTSQKVKKPLTVVEGELRLLWRNVLGDAAGGAAIQADDDFFTVGGSSLLLVRLQNALKEQMGVSLPLQDLYAASTLGKMAAKLSDERSQTATETIDWEKETLIPAGFLDAAQRVSTTSSAPRQHQQRVLFTGATSFLGGEVLRQLIDDADVEKIYCIAVAADAKDKVPSSDKVSVFVGSLLSPNLGLSNQEVAFLRGNVDRIVHSGAQGHCLNNYTSVRQANFISTQFLTSLALTNRVPLHFMSSGRVILQSGAVETDAVSMSAHPPPTDGSQGFTSSKWASERFLERVAEASRLPIVVHRTCSVIGSRAPHDDAMNSVIRFSRLSHTVPDVPQAQGFFDFADVGEVAAAIAQTAAPAGLTFRHHSSGVRIPFAKLANRMSELYGGGSYEVVPMAAWIAQARELGIEDLIVSYLEANVAGATSTLVFPYLGRGSSM